MSYPIVPNLPLKNEGDCQVKLELPSDLVDWWIQGFFPCILRPKLRNSHRRVIFQAWSFFPDRHSLYKICTWRSLTFFSIRNQQRLKHKTPLPMSSGCRGNSRYLCSAFHGFTGVGYIFPSTLHKPHKVLCFQETIGFFKDYFTRTPNGGGGGGSMLTLQHFFPIEL